MDSQMFSKNCSACKLLIDFFDNERHLAAAAQILRVRHCLGVYSERAFDTRAKSAFGVYSAQPALG